MDTAGDGDLFPRGPASEMEQKQIPFGNDRQKEKSKNKSKGSLAFELVAGLGEFVEATPDQAVHADDDKGNEDGG